MKTRDRILNASLRLFNERGERNVSTNHIAAELGMSPGNLYYHFRNKQALVAELFNAYSLQVTEFLALPQGRSLTFADKVQYFESIFESMWEYRFFYRDLGHVINESETLRQAYRQFSSRTVANGKKILLEMRDVGLLAASNEDVDALMLNIWVIVTSWPSVLQTLKPEDDQQSQVSREQLRRGIYQIVCLIEPYAGNDKAALKNLKIQYLGDQKVDPLWLFEEFA